MGRGVRRAARRRRRTARPSWSTTPSGRAVHPGAGPRARRRRAAGLRLRPLRGHRPAGARRGRRTRAEVREISLGDYVLNGGEVAALAITEAVVRLLPGFMGNPESLAEESHEDGLLEYPVYTKPASWRGHEVPPVLLSGDHARDRGLAARAGGTPHRRAPPRPRCTRPRCCSTTSSCGWSGRATPASCSCCSGPAGSRRQQDNPGVEIPALHETLDDVRAWLAEGHRARRAQRGPAGRRGPRPGRRAGEAWDIGRLMVAPDLHGPRPRPAAARHIEEAAPAEARRRTRCSPGPAARATSGCTRRPATALRGELAPGVVRHDQAAPDLLISGALSRAVADFAPRSSRPKDRPEDTHGGSAPAPATGGAGAAGHAARWSDTDSNHRTRG